MRNLPPIIYASVVGLVLACSDNTGPVEPPSQSPRLPAGTFQVSPATATLQPGQTFRFTTTYSGNPALMGTPGQVAWQSSNDNVATVTGGNVRAVAGGEARIVAIWGGSQASAAVRVVGPTKKHEDVVSCLKSDHSPERRPMTQC